MSHSERLRARILDRSARPAVLGLGYVGLPLAVVMARAGFRVIGVDTDRQRVAGLREGRSYVEDVPSAEVSALVREGLLQPVESIAEAKGADIISICVPTPLTKSREPDLSYVAQAVNDVGSVLRPGHLVILESTTYPGTTEEVALPALEKAGYRVGQDVFLAFSPERIDPGNSRFPLRSIPKIVGGVTPQCTELAALFYEQVVERVVRVSSPKVAEMAKLLENTYRSVNIALVNEIALMARKLGVDVWEVIEAAATKPFGFTPFYPGPGTGGHCIPSDPLYLSWRTRLNGYDPRFIALADEINRAMPLYVVDLIADALNEDGKPLKGATVHVLGVAYKGGVGDVRESPALEVVALLCQKGARVTYSDPYVRQVAVAGRTLTSVDLSEDVAAGADCVAILTAHPGVDYTLVARRARVIVDTRNALKGVPAVAGRLVKL